MYLGYRCSSMCWRLGLCAVVWIYAPAFWSMRRYFGLCVIIPIYAHSFRSMRRYSDLCALISVYASLFRSMRRYFGLCVVIPIYAPSHPVERITITTNKLNLIKKEVKPSCEKGLPPIKLINSIHQLILP